MAKKIEPIPLPTHEEIAACAYKIYLEEGSVPGHELDHWLRAEAQMMEERLKDQKKKARTTTIRQFTANSRAV